MNDDLGAPHPYLLRSDYDQMSNQNDGKGQNSPEFMEKIDREYDSAFAQNWSKPIIPDGERMTEAELLEGLKDAGYTQDTRPPSLPEPSATSNATNKAIEASLHSAELLRAQGNALLAIAQSFKAESDALADDIEQRTKKFHERIVAIQAHTDQSREQFKSQCEKLDQFMPKGD